MYIYIHVHTLMQWTFFGNWDKTSNTTTVHLYMGSWLPDEAKQKLDRRKKWYWKLSKWIWVHIGLQKLKSASQRI